MSTTNFREACTTYRYLLDRGFTDKASIILVGDRHRLTKTERNCLYRGVTSQLVGSRRQGKIVPPPRVRQASLAIDWYNVLITVESRLRGLPVFLAEDGVVRDASATHGSYRPSHITAQAMDALVSTLATLWPSRVVAWLDSPIAFSGEMARDLRSRLLGLPFPCEVSLALSADYPLKAFAGIVATSDSVLLDKAESVCDLARIVLVTAWGFSPPPVQDLFPSSPGEPGR
jgi:hypothetical protein